MKKILTLFIVPLLVLSLLIILVRWHAIHNEQHQDILLSMQLSKLHTLLQSQMLFLKSDDAFFKEEILQSNTKLIKNFQQLQQSISAKQINIKALQHHVKDHIDLVETYISTQAVFHNELYYLLDYIMQTNDIKVKKILFKYMEHTLSNKIPKKISLSPNMSQKEIQKLLLARHLYIFKKSYVALKRVKLELHHEALIDTIKKESITLEKRYTTIYSYEHKFILVIAINTMLLLGVILYLLYVNARSLKAQNILNSELENFLSVFKKSMIYSVSDTQGNILEVNELFCDVSGYDKESLIGKNYDFLQSHTKTQQFWQQLQSKQAFHGTLINRTKNAQEIILDTIVVPLLNEKNEISKYVSIQHDISDLVQAKEAAQES